MDATDQRPDIAPPVDNPATVPAKPKPPESGGNQGTAKTLPAFDMQAIMLDAIDYQPPGLALEARPLPFPARSVLYLLIFFVFAMILWATLSEVDKIVTAEGKLIPTGTSVQLQPMDRSVIVSINVSVGQLVHANEVIATLDPTFTNADVISMSSRLSSLTTQEDRLRAEMAGLDYVAEPNNDDSQIQESFFRKRRSEYLARLDALVARNAKSEAELKTNHDDQINGAKRLEIVTTIEKMRRELFEQKAGSRLSYLESQKERQQLESDLESLRNKEQELRYAMAGSQADQDAFITEWTKKVVEEITTVSRDRRAAAEEFAKAERRGKLVQLRAPWDGIVLEVPEKLSAGSVVREAESLVTLVPANAILEVEIDIAARDIGLIRTGDQAKIKLEAFPFQKHGTLPGFIRAVSPDAYQRDAQKGGGTFFRARATLVTTELKDVPAGIHLIPGMATTTEIMVGRRTIMSYLLYPLFRALDEGMREP